MQREDTKNTIVLITNILYTVIPIDYVLGGNINLPSYIKNNRYLISFESERKGKAYNDDLCLG